MQCSYDGWYSDWCTCCGAVLYLERRILAIKAKPMPFVCMLGTVALSNMFIAKGKTIVENGIVTWEGSNPVFMAVFFSIILINVIIKMYIDKKKDQ